MAVSEAILSGDTADVYFSRTKTILARQGLDVVPGFGWALKGAFGFTATVALGRAAIEYFEAGAPLTTTRFTRIADALDRVTTRIPFLGAASG